MKPESKVEKVMGEFKRGKLKSGGSDDMVKNRQQAIAIALSEAGISNQKGGKSQVGKVLRGK